MYIHITLLNAVVIPEQKWDKNSVKKWAYYGKLASLIIAQGHFFSDFITIHGAITMPWHIFCIIIQKIVLEEWGSHLGLTETTLTKGLLHLTLLPLPRSDWTLGILNAYSTKYHYVQKIWNKHVFLQKCLLILFYFRVPFVKWSFVWLFIKLVHRTQKVRSILTLESE